MGFIEYAMAATEHGADVEGRGARVCIFADGDAIVAGEVVTNYADGCCDVPIDVVSDSRIPGWIGSDTDCILLSCTGESGDLVRVYDGLRRRGCRVFCISPDGWLSERCRRDGIRPVTMPSDLRMAEGIGAALGALCRMVQDLGVCDACDRLRSVLSSFEDDGPDRAEGIADSLRSKVPSFYSQSSISACSNYWKRAFNRVAGGPAFHGELPEFDHNELVGWADPNDHAKDLLAVAFDGGGDELTSSLSALMSDVLDINGREVLTVAVKGSDPMEENIDGIVLGERVMAVIAGEGGMP